jgi:hypothetical protein
MLPLKLHTKTTLLASAITVAVLIAALLTISARVVDLVRDEQKALAEWQAISLAELISNLPTPHDQQDIVNAASLVRNSRPNVVGVRVWERAGGVFKSLEQIESCVLEPGGTFYIQGKTPPLAERQHAELLARLDRLDHQITELRRQIQKTRINLTL